MERNSLRQDQLFSKLYSEYSPKMMRLCKYYASDSSDAEDIYHDAFIKIIQNFDSCRDQQNPEAWIKKIIINTALERLRKKKKFQNIDNDFPQSQEPDQDNTTNNRISVKELLDKYHLSSTDVYEIVEKLPFTFKITFILYYREGFSHKEISTQLGITEKSSRANLAKSKKLIRDRLNKKLRKKYLEYSTLILLFLSEDECSMVASEHERGWETLSISEKHHPLQTFKWQFLYKSKTIYFIGLTTILSIVVVMFFLSKKENLNKNDNFIPEKHNFTSPVQNEKVNSNIPDSLMLTRSTEPDKRNEKVPIATKPEKLDTASTDTVIRRQTIIIKKTIVINE